VQARNEGVCDAYLGETRIESECQRGDGLVFRFRRQTCVPHDLYMHSNQPVLCLATWTEAVTSATTGPSNGGGSSFHQFTLLRHAEQQHNFYWLLRTPISTQISGGNGGSPQFAAYLFKDLVADTSNGVNETRNYIRFDAVRNRPRSVSEVCADEYDICSDLVGNGYADAVLQSRCSGVGTVSSGIDFRLTCPLTCGLCNESNPNTCNLPPSWIGTWQTRAASENKTVVATTTINSTTVRTSTSGDGDATWRCIQWQSADAVSSSNEVMLVTDYDNGCRQRFRCVRVIRQSAALTYLQVSRSAVWPLVRSGRDPIDCRAFRYDAPPMESRGETATAAMSASSSIMLALYGDDGVEVNCDLPEDLVNYAITLPPAAEGSGVMTNTSCLASVSLTNDGTRMQLDVQCSNGGDDDDPQLPVELERGLTSYACLDSSLSASASAGAGDRVVVTRWLRSSDDDDSESKLVCWLFSSAGGTTSRSRQFQMFVGSTGCDAVVFRHSSYYSAGRHRPSSSQLPSSATFVRTSSTTSNRDVVVPQSTTSTASATVRRPGRLTKSPRTFMTQSPDAVTVSQFEPTESDVVVDAVFPSRQLNATTADVVEGEELSEKAKSAFVIGVVVFLLALVQAIALCKC
jgi:hypothetical protein